MPSTSISYWQSTSQPVPLSTDLPRSSDVAIIGGGLMGVATSYWLARAGISAALLEAEEIGWGATGRNGGFMVAGPAGSYVDAIERVGHETARSVMTDTLLNQRLVHQVVAEEAIDCDYRDPGHLRLALSAHEEDQLRAEVAAFQADGFAVTFLDRQAVQELIQTPLASHIRGARLKVGQAMVHSARFVRGLAQAALRRGAHAYQAHVHALTPEGEHIRLHTSRGMLDTGTVIVAANAWIGALLPELRDFILPRREQMLAYAPWPKQVFSTAISAAVTSGEYFQQALDGTILIGGCHTVALGEDRGTQEMIPSPVVQTALEAVLPQLFPELQPLHVIQRWAGLLDYTTDQHPIVDCLPATPRVLIVCGLSGHGMPFGLRFGQLLTEAVVNTEIPAALKPYRLGRPGLKKWAGT